MGYAVRMKTSRLTAADVTLAKQTFALMSEVFEMPAAPLSDGYVSRLLARADFWAIAAVVDGEVIGGLTAHTVPMTRAEVSEIFIFDIAVRADKQRQGVGRQLIEHLQHEAAVLGFEVSFVAADNEDEHAIEFYQALGGERSPVTMFTFAQSSKG